MTSQPRAMPWVIFFEDASMPPEVFTKEEPARKRYGQCYLNWDCHLLVPDAELTRLRARNEQMEACVKAADALKPWLLRLVQLEQQIEVEKVEKAYDEARAGLGAE